MEKSVLPSVAKCIFFSRVLQRSTVSIRVKKTRWRPYLWGFFLKNPPPFSFFEPISCYFMWVSASLLSPKNEQKSQKDPFFVCFWPRTSFHGILVLFLMFLSFLGENSGFSELHLNYSNVCFGLKVNQNFISKLVVPMVASSLFDNAVTLAKHLCQALPIQPFLPT